MGLASFLFFLGYESTADFQKFMFKENPANAGWVFTVSFALFMWPFIYMTIMWFVCVNQASFAPWDFTNTRNFQITQVSL